MLKRSAGAALLLAFSACTTLHAQTRSSEKLSWLAGCWELERRGAVVNEMWLPPRGGLLLGVSRTVRNDSVIEYEVLRIEEKDQALVLTAQPSRQPSASFTAASAELPLTFENLQHDFPQRIIYRPLGSDSLIGRIEGMRNGVLRGVDYRYKRVACS